MSGGQREPQSDGAASPPPGEGGAHHPRPRHNLRTYFLTGIVVAAPITITAYLTLAFVNFVDNHVTPLIPTHYNPETYLPFSIPGLGIAIVVCALTLLGALTTNFAGRAIVKFAERAVDRVPVVRSIYTVLKQIFETVMSHGRGSFTRVGLIEHPRPGLWAVVFIAGETKGEIATRMGREMVTVFLPHIPNPTSGFILFVPRESIIYLDMTVEEAAKLVLSAGLVEPPHTPRAAARTAPPV